MEIESDDYHDFVIKNGRLIGEFEQMYQKSRDIPWRQNQQNDWLDIRLAHELLRAYAPFDRIVDFGCGLGYFLQLMAERVGGKGTTLIGYDVSPTCCEKARLLHHNMEFHELDLMAEPPDLTPGLGKAEDAAGSRRTLLTIRGSLWYVYPKMENTVRNIAHASHAGDLLLVVQNFPPLASSFVGKDVIPGPDAIVRWFSPHFLPLKSIWVEDNVSTGNDNWFIGIFSRRGES